MDAADVERLIAAATSARANAYCPYSGYAVGAAVLTDRGAVVAGCNVENASYPAGICAERTAIAAAVAGGARGLQGLVLVVDAAEPAAPCGLCRQTAAEFGRDLPVVLATVDGQRRATTLDELLPGAFSAADLDGSPPGRPISG